jgi:cholinesterase
MYQSFVALSLASLAFAAPQAPPTPHGSVSPPPPVTAFRPGQTVNTTSGPVTGHASSWQKEVSEYLGIPFAVPPVGSLRWAAPQAYKSSKPVGAHKFSPDCAANVGAPAGSKISYGSVADTVKGILGQAGDEFSEDCLTLNVWTKPQSGEKKKAVMVWIYGGGFNTGNSASPAYNGARLAKDQDVVLVSIK